MKNKFKLGKRTFFCFVLSLTMGLVSSCENYINVNETSAPGFTIPLSSIVTQLGAVTQGSNPPASFGQGIDHCKGVAVDPRNGDVYCAEERTGNIAETNASARYDLFLAKFNYLGAVKWIVQLGASTKVPGAHGHSKPGN